ncbi:hypothetical protein GQ53DRAFT_803026 [Thozetella sp. PMI_491]|nr:hypothetical protein GQ53DRAFT_803026 [Thozetella sp. PMI_491]
MVVSLDTVLQVYNVVKKAIDIYKTIQNAPKQMEKLTSELSITWVYLGRLKRLLSKGSGRALGQLSPEEKVVLESVIDGIKSNADKGIELMTNWKSDAIPGGNNELSFRWKWLTNGWLFVVGDAGKTIDDLIAEIRGQQDQIGRILALMTHEKVEALRAEVGRVDAKMDKMNADMAALSVPQRKISPSPSPPPPRKDYGIIFVDPGAVGRGPVSEYLTKLMKEWTQRTGGDWRIKNINSAGFFVKHRAGYLDLIEELEYKKPSHKLALRNGDSAPNKVVVDAVFDNKAFDYPFKQKYHQALMKADSKGIPKNIFKSNDFILVFTERERENMLRLRKAVLARDGAEAVPKGKGRVVHLGTYVKVSSGNVLPFEDVPKNDDGSFSREKWNTKVSELKLAIKRFLKKEMKWKQPDATAKVT